MTETQIDRLRDSRDNAQRLAANRKKAMDRKSQEIKDLKSLFYDAYGAMSVISLTAETAKWLTENDPKGLEQLRGMISKIKSQVPSVDPPTDPFAKDIIGE